jgi:three-Cys-motif partner protein
MPTSQLFGGDWTEDKLERVRKYLRAYVHVLKDKRFRFAYIDAFAGTGYRTDTQSKRTAALPLLELAEDEPQKFLDGSARIALQVEPRFHKYIFIEKDPKRCAELEQLKVEFPALKDDIVIENKEANSYLQGLCSKPIWNSRRAVLFLDPFGMQVTWATIEAIAKTQAIDLWILFPLGIGVNRMLTTSGEISDAWRRKLDMMFGARDWYEAFYETQTMNDLFGESTSMVKISDFDSISKYFVKRLKTVFAGVADNPLPLFNS